MRYVSTRKTGLRFAKRFVHTACRPAALTAALFAGVLLFSCADTPPDLDDEYLIRVNERVVTVSDFKKAFEITKSAYPQNLSQHSALLQEAQARLLDQMIEELLVLQRAAELRLELTESEVSEAVAKIKADYPEGVFDQMLLEHAVSYSFWEKRLKTRLMIEKVVEEEVQRPIALTAEEIAKFYKENYEDKTPTSGKDAEQADGDGLIAAQLRRQKAEAAYPLWIKNLKEKYAVEINRTQWQRLTGL